MGTQITRPQKLTSNVQLKKVSIGSDRCFPRNIEWTSILKDLFWKHHDTLMTYQAFRLRQWFPWHHMVKVTDQVLLDEQVKPHTSLEYNLFFPTIMGGRVFQKPTQTAIQTTSPGAPGFLQVVRNCIMLQRCLVQVKWWIPKKNQSEMIRNEYKNQSWILKIFQLVQVVL